MRWFYLSFFFILFSCSNSLERTYDPFTLEKDVLEIEQIISKDELSQLLDYIKLTSSLGVDIRGRTYNELLNEIKKSEYKQKEIDNSILIQNVQELLNERLEDDKCDEFISEIQRKGIHNHNTEEHEQIIWDDDYFIDY
ncbi:MAG: hypothetical protein CMD08_02180 [Flavobacteriales bacterium]|nr:hypothetical protein [Flavobacteriales bacterium]|tara:strand:- start:461 stop:877 length:417 start_codon:yes stop_codon:yes gene_type:complete